VNGSAGPVLHDEQSPNTLDLARYRYARAKVEAEGLCRAAARDGLRVVVVCPCEVYGPNDTGLVTAGTLVDFARGSTVLVCDGGTSVVHVEDVAAGIVAAFERGRSGERYILGGDNVTIKEMAQLSLQILGKNSRLVVLPNGLIRGVARAGSALRVPLPFNPAIIPYATLYWFMSNAKAQRELGVTFRSARETLAPTLAWLREAGHIAA
jgi:dihydroflavonol-4-reductase